MKRTLSIRHSEHMENPQPNALECHVWFASSTHHSKFNSWLVRRPRICFPVSAGWSRERRRQAGRQCVPPTVFLWWWTSQEGRAGSQRWWILLECATHHWLESNVITSLECEDKVYRVNYSKNFYCSDLSHKAGEEEEYIYGFCKYFIVYFLFFLMFFERCNSIISQFAINRLDSTKVLSNFI